VNMKDIIERYIQEVATRLPENMREEVKKEMRSNIEDMLSDSPTKEEVISILKSLGEPRIIANEYRETKRYLIAPEWFDDYLKVLKIVLIVFGSVALVFGLIDALMNPEAVGIIGRIAEIFARTVSGIFKGLLSAFAIVTLVFALISSYGKSIHKKPWEPETLPPLHKTSQERISPTSSIAELIVTIIFGAIAIYVLYNANQYLGWFTNDGNWTPISQLFDQSHVLKFIPFFIASLVLAVVAIAIKIKDARWTLGVGISRTIHQIFSFVVVVMFVMSPNMIHADFIARLAEFFDLQDQDIAEYIRKACIGISVFIGLMVTIDLVTTWVKTTKYLFNRIR
jgi:hypothetical protein